LSNLFDKDEKKDSWWNSSDSMGALAATGIFIIALMVAGIISIAVALKIALLILGF
jgi:hypothetical protein